MSQIRWARGILEQHRRGDQSRYESLIFVKAPALGLKIGACPSGSEAKEGEMILLSFLRHPIGPKNCKFAERDRNTENIYDIKYVGYNLIYNIIPS